MELKNGVVQGPSRIRRGAAAGLTIGLSGIRYFYLRLFDPFKNPSNLVPL
ncbi:MAG TPA: hypothetical protein VE130_00955 [Nitrososphaeraceae archaeon]|nr:hypothetical protein [Nitrososphaeraceae archaeon]